MCCSHRVNPQPAVDIAARNNLEARFEDKACFGEALGGAKTLAASNKKAVSDGGMLAPAFMGLETWHENALWRLRCGGFVQ